MGEAVSCGIEQPDAEIAARRERLHSQLLCQGKALAVLRGGVISTLRRTLRQGLAQGAERACFLGALAEPARAIARVQGEVDTSRRPQ